ncbi:MAG: phenylacetate--CoA ligase family protein [Thermodesulfobacteriota bacterium]
MSTRRNIEKTSLKQLVEIQNSRLRHLVKWSYERTRLYRRKFEEVGLKPKEIRNVEDLRKVPLTRYLEDFVRTPLSEKLAVPMEKVKEVSSTSGTLSGFTQPFLMTKEEARAYYQNEARMRAICGVTPADVVQVLTGFECCRNGYYYLGSTVLMDHAGRRNMDHQIRLTQAMGVTVLEHLPSHVLLYFERAKELGIDIRKTKLRMVVGVGEGWAEAYRRKVEKEYGIPFRSAYGLVETSVLAAECPEGGGMHTAMDNFIVEVIDPETGKNLGPGEEGELVITPLNNIAMPLIRYRTGDVGSIIPYQRCDCGNTHQKISLVRGRVAQFIKVGGKRILPMDIEEIVATTPGLGDEYQIILDSPGELNRLKMKAEIRPETQNQEELKKKMEETTQRNLGVEMEVEFVPLGALGRSLFKAQRVIRTYQ